MTRPAARRLLSALGLAAAFSLPAASGVLAQGDEPGTLKGARGAPKATTPSAAPKAKPKGSGLMEEEGIFYKSKPSRTPKPR
ncbi:MAG: hypothetical protein AB7O88_17590 [Reyranellaceae bacterium]